MMCNCPKTRVLRLIEGAPRERRAANIIRVCESSIHEHDELIFCFSPINPNSPVAEVGNCRFVQPAGKKRFDTGFWLNKTSRLWPNNL